MYWLPIIHGDSCKASSFLFVSLVIMGQYYSFNFVTRFKPSIFHITFLQSSLIKELYWALSNFKLIIAPSKHESVICWCRNMSIRLSYYTSTFQFWDNINILSLKSSKDYKKNHSIPMLFESSSIRIVELTSTVIMYFCIIFLGGQTKF